WTAFEQPRKDATLAVAKIWLAELFEDFAHAHLRGLFDLLVGVGKRQAEELGELASDGRLANSHHADERNRPVDACGEVLYLAVAQGGGFDGHCRSRYRCANRRASLRRVVLGGDAPHEVPDCVAGAPYPVHRSRLV